jgi:hypothetical protein
VLLTPPSVRPASSSSGADAVSPLSPSTRLHVMHPPAKEQQNRRHRRRRRQQQQQQPICPHNTTAVCAPHAPLQPPHVQVIDVPIELEPPVKVAAPANGAYDTQHTASHGAHRASHALGLGSHSAPERASEQRRWKHPRYICIISAAAAAAAAANELSGVTAATVVFPATPPALPCALQPMRSS